jgi:hypothetical protein
MTMTKKAIDQIQKRAHRYNWYSERVIAGKASKEDKEVMDEEWNELDAILDMLKALGFKVECDEIFDMFYMTIVSIKIDGKLVYLK